MTALSGIIYIITDGEHIKVGRTSSAVVWRISDLQAGNPRELTVISTVDTDKTSDEALLHCYLRERGLWLRREWFKRHAPLIESFKRNDHADGVLKDLGLDKAGERVALLRKMCGLKPTDVSRLSGLGYGVRIDTVESGQQVMTTEIVTKLSSFFGVSERFLLCGEGAEPDAGAVKAFVDNRPGGFKKKGDFGKRLRALRGRTSFTQRGLSDAAGLSPAVVSQYETGRLKSPSIQTAVALADALNVRVSELLSDPTPQPEPAE